MLVGGMKFGAGTLLGASPGGIDTPYVSAGWVPPRR
jgi:hypothetical protein